MRVISGKYKGKQIQGFNIDGTRPTMDRIKESLFSMIQDKIPDSICLDLFAGSGALGIEALSMGAKDCTFVDNSKQIFSILKNNLVNIENSYLINSNYDKYLKTTSKQFDIIFLDPPYKLNLINKAIQEILNNDVLKENGIIVCEYEIENIVCELKLIKEKKYGSKYIRIYKK